MIDTPYYRIRLNEQGYPDSIYDKEAGRELVQQGKCVNELQIFEDRPSQYDNWNLDASYREKMWGARLQTGPGGGGDRTCADLYPDRAPFSGLQDTTGHDRVSEIAEN